MKENKKFRNHISVVVEQIGGTLVAIAVLIFLNLAQNAERLSEENLSVLSGKVPLIAAGAGVILLLLLGNRLRVWAKTWITIEENAVVIERNTINKKKDTIGIPNISNINLEQNLFEMLVGTCKVKLDTNSRSTADSTDVKIVLKKKDGEEFRRILSVKLKKDNHEECCMDDQTRQADDRDEAFDIKADGSDIFVHGLYSIHLFSVVVLVFGILFAAGNLYGVIGKADASKSVVAILSSVVVAGTAIVSSVWDIAKDFIRYYEFRAKRIDEKIYIKYGFLKKMEYTVPVDKIQALRIRQSILARLAGKYMAEIVNVGMGDDKEEQNSFLVLYRSKSQLEETIRILLPEFSGALQEEVKPMPASCWAARTPAALLYCVVVVCAAWAAAGYVPKYSPAVWAGAALLVVFACIGMFLSFLTCGTGIGTEFLVVTNGYFGCTTLAVRYRNIQYAEIRQNFIARRFGIRKGNIHLLASSANVEHHVPYFKAEMEEKFARNMLL